ncbi:MAG: DNA polymerase IV [Myxococcota bacterium]
MVGGVGPRGVVSTASYEARPFGVHSAMPTSQARRLCPHGVFLPTRGRRYAEVSRQLMAILGAYSPAVQPLSLDEAFLDMSGSEALLGPAPEVAHRLLDHIERDLELTASVGVASSKFVAKVASDLHKPRGLTVVPAGTERSFLGPLPIERLWGVGPKTAPRLRALGLTRIEHLAAWPPEELERRFGGLGKHLWSLAQGIDDRQVEMSRVEKSIGAERTFDADVQGSAELARRLLPLCDEVAQRLRQQGLRARGVRVKLKHADFRVSTRQRPLGEPACDGGSLHAAARELLARLDTELPVRLVGVAAFDLVHDQPLQQGDLFATTSTDVTRRERLSKTLDAVEARFGRGALRRAEHALPSRGTFSSGE